MKKTLLGVALLGWLVNASAGAALAQPAPGLPATGEMRPGQLQQLFDAMLVMQAQEVLALSEQQYAQFLTRLRVLQDTRRRHQQERMRLIGELQRLTNPRSRQDASESELTTRLEALQELESRSAADIRKAYTAIDELLDVRQRARFRVLEEQVERRKLELVTRARQQNRTPPRRQQ